MQNRIQIRIQLFTLMRIRNPGENRSKKEQFESAQTCWGTLCRWFPPRRSCQLRCSSLPCWRTRSPGRSSPPERNAYFSICRGHNCTIPDDDFSLYMCAAPLRMHVAPLPHVRFCPFTAYLKYTVQLYIGLLADRTFYTWVSHKFIFWGCKTIIFNKLKKQVTFSMSQSAKMIKGDLPPVRG